MQTTTIQTRRIKNNNNNSEMNQQLDENDEQDEKSENVPRKNAPKKVKKVTKDVQKIFFSSIDPYDAPLTWWETEHVRYAINYPPVKSRLEKVMGSHVVRLTDRKYMQQLASNIYKDHVEQQKIRIERRKLAPPSIIKRLLAISYKALSEKLKDNKHSKIKFYM